MSKVTSINQKLFNLQQEIGTISKDATNPFYKSKYFDINSLIKQLSPLLKKHKLLLLQPIIDDEVFSKLICIETDQSTFSSLKLPDINDPQKLGSCITFFRRYTLASLLGLQAVDDDANATVQKEQKWLNVNTPEYSRAIEFLKNGGTIAQIEMKYSLSGKVKNELSKLQN